MYPQHNFQRKNHPMYQHLQMKKDVSCEFENFRKFSYLFLLNLIFFRRKLNRINLLYFVTYFLWPLAESSNTQSLKSMSSTLNTVSSQYKNLASNRDPKYRTKSREILKAYAANHIFFIIL